ncbi:putative Mg(2+) transporter [Martiniozyma asiatica (nom. inval.)]|nr:putative Mg(2+) transporter [Martiniozyma asiatica]
MKHSISTPAPFPQGVYPYDQNVERTWTRYGSEVSPNDESLRSHSGSSSRSDTSSVFVSSNPSTRRPSDSSSYNDVFFPVGQNSERRAWPDLDVLDAYKQETDRDNALRMQLENYKSSREGEITDEEVKQEVNFQYPLVSNVESETVSRNTANIKKNTDKQPHDEDFETWSSLCTTDKQERLEKLRFTYFREDLENTIHSSTIVGLLRGDLTWKDIFSPESYSNSSIGSSIVDTNHNNTDKQFPQQNKQGGLNTESSLGLQQANNLTKQTQTQTQTQTVPISNKKLESIQGNIKYASSSGISLNIPQNSSVNTPNNVSPFWLDVLNPTDEEMKVLARTFNIHPLTTEDIIMGETREKVEVFGNYYFVCFASFDIVAEHEKRKKHLRKRFKQQRTASISKTKSSKPDWINKIVKKVRNGSQSSSNSNKMASPLQRRNSRASRFSRSSRNSKSSRSTYSTQSSTNSERHTGNKELHPLNMYMVVFPNAIITFHFSPTPHTGNVRRRARLLKDYLSVTSDWIGYALIDDITDAFAPLIDTVRADVESIEDRILGLQSNDSDDDSEEAESESDSDWENYDGGWGKMNRRGSILPGIKSGFVRNGTEDERQSLLSGAKNSSNATNSKYSGSNKSITSSKSSVSQDTKIWRRKGDLLRDIGSCRRRIMSLMRLLSTKADVIKIFAKRCQEDEQRKSIKPGLTNNQLSISLTNTSNQAMPITQLYNISLYLGDIQDHVLTMTSSLSHYEKILARCHSNYLAQLNIDMTKVNNDMNDILGKITVLGTIVLPLNIVTGLWGMNCLVPGQDVDSLQWFWGIVAGMIMFSLICWSYAKRKLDM